MKQIKYRFLLFIALILGVVIIFPTTSCDKEEDDPIVDDTTDVNVDDFTVQIQNEKFYDYGWVVLHSLDGTEAVDFEKFEGDKLINFGQVDEEQVSTTVIKVRNVTSGTGSDLTQVSFKSYMAAPKGQWVLNGKSATQTLLGKVSLDYSYPNGGFNELNIYTTSEGIKTTSIPPNGDTEILNVYRLDNDGKYSMYGMINGYTGGYTGWLLNQDFSLEDTNYYELEINQPIDSKTITTSKPLKNINLYAFWNERNSNLQLFDKRYTKNDLDSETEHELLYSFDMPLNEYRFVGSERNISEVEDNFYSYEIYYDSIAGLPDNIDIPDQIVDGEYDALADKITDILPQGDVDYISGDWDYILSNTELIIEYRWTVHVAEDSTDIRLPVLPEEIIEELNVAYINSMKIKGLGIVDYNSVDGYVDFIEHFFIETETPVNQRYDSKFAYSQFFDDNKN